MRSEAEKKVVKNLECVIYLILFEVEFHEKVNRF